MIDAPAIWLPPAPAIIQIGEAWEHRVGRQLARMGLPIGARLGVLAELRRLQRPNGRIDHNGLGDLSRWAGVDLAFVPATTGVITQRLARSFTFIGSATDSTSSIGISSISPGAIAKGDFCVIFNTTAGNATEVIPSGFTSLQSTAVGTSGRAVISAKRLLGTETTVSGLASGTLSWIVAVFRPDGLFTGFTGHSGGAQGTTGDPTAQAMNVSGVKTPIILLGQMYSNDGGSGYRTIDTRNTSPTMTELAGTTGVSPQGQYAHYTLYNAGSTPANTTYDMDDEGQNILQSVYLTFS